MFGRFFGVLVAIPVVGCGNIGQELLYISAVEIYFIYYQNIGQGFLLDLLDILLESGERQPNLEQSQDEQQYHDSTSNRHPYTHTQLI